MRWKTLTFPVVAAAVLLAGFAPELAAQAKLGVVDFEQALLSTADMKKQAATLEAKFKPRQDELDRLGQELQEIQTKLQSATDAEASRRLQLDGERKQRDAQRLSEDLQAEVDFERQNILSKGAERLRAVVDTLRTEKGLDIVVDISTALSFSPTLDLTAAATTAYDAANPVN